MKIIDSKLFLIQWPERDWPYGGWVQGGFIFAFLENRKIKNGFRSVTMTATKISEEVQVAFIDTQRVIQRNFQLVKWFEVKGCKATTVHITSLTHWFCLYQPCAIFSESIRLWAYDNTKAIMDTQTNWKFPHSAFCWCFSFFANQLSKLVSDTVKCPTASDDNKTRL